MTQTVTEAGSETRSTYERLAERFAEHHTRPQGGRDLIYISGEQVISRLNEVLGVTGWSFSIINQGETDVEAWVHGHLQVRIGDELVTRQQYGSMDLLRGRDFPQPTTDRFKGAATDALKKCASLLGVGLYLYDDDERAEVAEEMRAQQPTGGWGSRTGRMPDQTAPARAATPNQVSPDKRCVTCGKPLTATRFTSGAVWTADQLRDHGLERHNQVLCYEHFKEAETQKSESTQVSTGEAQAASVPENHRTPTSAASSKPANARSELEAAYHALEKEASVMALVGVFPFNTEWTAANIERQRSALAARIASMKEYDRVLSEALEFGIDDSADPPINQVAAEVIQKRTAMLKDAMSKAQAV